MWTGDFALAEVAGGVARGGAGEAGGAAGAVAPGAVAGAALPCAAGETGVVGVTGVAAAGAVVPCVVGVAAAVAAVVPFASEAELQAVAAGTIRAAARAVRASVRTVVARRVVDGNMKVLLSEVRVRSRTLPVPSRAGTAGQCGGVHDRT